MYSDLAVSQSSKLETTSSYSIRRMKLKSKIISHLNIPVVILFKLFSELMTSDEILFVYLKQKGCIITL